MPKPSSSIIKDLSVSYPKATSGILFGGVSRQHIFTEWHLKETLKCPHHKLALCIIISNLSVRSSENYWERKLFLLTEPKTATFSPQHALKHKEMHFSRHLLQVSEVRISYRDQSAHDHWRCWLMWGFKPYSPTHHMGHPATLKGECQRKTWNKETT